MWGRQATQEVLRGHPCDCGDSQGAVCHGHVTLGVQTSASAQENARPGHAGHSVYRPGCTYQHVSQPRPHVCRARSRRLAFLTLVSSAYSNPPCKITSPDSPSASLPFSLLNSSFLFPSHSQWTKNKMEKKLFLTSLLHHQKHKRAVAFLWNHQLFLITFS